MKCKKCKYTNSKSNKFCRKCRADLKAQVAAVSPPVEKTPRCLAENQKTSPVGREMREENKNHLKPVWLLQILLALVVLWSSGCSGPGEGMSDFADHDQDLVILAGEDIDCDEIYDRVSELNYPGSFDCDSNPGTCEVSGDITGLDLDDYTDIIIHYEWEGEQPGLAACDGPPDNFTCQFPDEPEIINANFYLSLERCLEIDCDEFHERVVEAGDFLFGEVVCDYVNKTCVYYFDDITSLSLDDYTDIGIEYQWEGEPRREVTWCKDSPDFHCEFPYEPDIDLVDFYITLDGCEEYIAMSDGWIKLAQDGGVSGVAGGGGDGEGKQAADEKTECDDLSDKVKEVEHLEEEEYQSEVWCTEEGICDYVIEDVLGWDQDDYTGLGINFQWGDGLREEAECDINNKQLWCEFPYQPEFDDVDLYLTMSDCEERLTDSILVIAEIHEEDTEDDSSSQPQSGQSSDCCEITEVSNVHYTSTTTMRRLHFDIECDSNEGWLAGTYDDAVDIVGAVFIGADQDIFWADVSCYRPVTHPGIRMNCFSNGHVEQKVSWTKAKLSNEECEWETPKFYTPTYTKGAEPRKCSLRSSDGSCLVYE